MDQDTSCLAQPRFMYSFIPKKKIAIFRKEATSASAGFHAGPDQGRISNTQLIKDSCNMTTCCSLSENKLHEK